MRYIINESNDPAYNLALEDYCLTGLETNEDLFILWRNAPVVVLGKHQVAAQEVNVTYAEQEGIRVVRRCSGGGAVYHDLGNVNFTFIVNCDDPAAMDFRRFVQPVIRALAELGVAAEQSGRNDMLVAGRKISGNAQRLYKKRFMHHGTLLFDVDFDQLTKVLNVKMDKIQSKGITSVRSRVANISEFIADCDVLTFKERLFQQLCKQESATELVLTPAQLAEVEAIADGRYRRWEWNFAESPDFAICNARRFACGKVEAWLDVHKSVLRDAAFTGDFLSVRDLGDLQQALKNCAYTRDALRDRLQGQPLTEYFGKITEDEFLDLLCGEA